MNHRFLRLLFCIGCLAGYSHGSPNARLGEHPTSRATTAPVDVLVTLSGADSEIPEPTYVRITTKEAFQSLYLRHLGKDPAQFDAHYNEYQVPTIDFDRCMVVAVFQGNTWNTANLYVREVHDERARLVVRFDRHSYQTFGFGSDGGGKRVTPFGFFVMPRSEKEIVLEENVRQYLNEGPRWQECARLAAR